jgi:phosphate transport system substrate-binding protein
MKMMKMVMSAAVVAVSVVGCGGQSSTGSSENTKSVAQDLGPAGEFYGSDTLKELLISADLGSGAGLSVEGKGTGVGEACIRNGVGSGGFCGAGQQVLAPMSRDFNAPRTSSGAACLGGASAGGIGSDGRPRDAACCPGESSNAIALDAVSAYVKLSTYTALANNGITTTELRRIFFSDNNPGGCITTWSALGLTNPAGNTIKVYRRDDLSGTTDTFRSLLGGSTWCPGVTVVSEAAGLPAACTAAGLTNATDCIGLLTGNDGTAIGFSGGSAKNANNEALKLRADGFPGGLTNATYVAPTKANIRLLISGSTARYPLSRYLFLNENVNVLKSFEEETLYNWIYDPNTSDDFEAIITGQGFITCSDTSALACGGTAGQGRGAGKCKGT